MNGYLLKSDFGEDFLRWLNKREATPLDDKRQLEKLQEEIIKNKDTALAYFLATEFPYKVYRMRKIILENKDPKYAYLFAQNVPNCDIKALQQVVVESGNTKYICQFACFVSGADGKLLEALVLKSKTVKYAHMLLKHVKGSSVKRCKDIILNSGKPRYLFELAKHVSSPREIARIQDLIIKSGSFTYMRLFAEKIKGANIEKIEQAVLDSDNVKEIKRFAKYVKKSKMKRFVIVL